MSTHSTWIEDKMPQSNKTTYGQYDWPKCARDKCNTWDRSLNGRDDTCVTFHTTSCESVTDVYIVNTTCTHEDRPWTQPEQDYNHDIVTNMLKDDRWTIKQGWCKDSTRAHEMSPSVCKHKGKKPKKAMKLDAAKILKGVAATTT